MWSEGHIRTVHRPEPRGKAKLQQRGPERMVGAHNLNLDQFAMRMSRARRWTADVTTQMAGQNIHGAGFGNQQVDCLRASLQLGVADVRTIAQDDFPAEFRPIRLAISLDAADIHL